MFTVLRGGEVYNPDPVGKADVLLVGDKIARIGEVDIGALEHCKLALEVIDVEDCLVVPGFIDPHEHLLGGSGEEGFRTQTPEISLSEIVAGGITTVVGCLGTDTTTKSMPGLLAKAKAFNEEGITSYIYSGGYNVPPSTLTGSVRNDMLFVAEVIGAGEIAMSDARSTEPTIHELARVVRDGYVGGLLTEKAGVTHFHVGSGRGRLAPLRSLLDDYDIETASLYPTHVKRSEELMLEAVELSRRGVTVDIDTVEGDLARWVIFFLDHGGDPLRLTVSSDAAVNSPRAVWDQVRSCVLDHGLPFVILLRMVTSNTSSVLKLTAKGRLVEGADAEVVAVQKQSLEIVEVIAKGRPFVRKGECTFRERFLQSSNRKIELHGEKLQAASNNGRTARWNSVPSTRDADRYWRRRTERGQPADSGADREASEGRKTRGVDDRQ
ncbi:MAG: beta-aspartyl-peptidase [Acidobacteriaceae bacterium]|nr:beta-aspartyl-peptidase [Acidobacteriaceae bacterium]